MRSLSERLDEYAEAWRPQPGDKLIGTVVGLDQRTSAFEDKPYPVLTIEVEESSTEAGRPLVQGTEKAWHAFHTVPRNELRKLRPKVGERIGIAYHGRGDKAYERYRVVLERPKPQLNWDDIASDTSAQDRRADDGGPGPDAPSEEKEEEDEDEREEEEEEDISF